MKFVAPAALTLSVVLPTLASPTLSLDSFKHAASSIARQSLFNIFPANFQLPFGLTKTPDYSSKAATCFPALSFTHKDTVPDTLDNWWW